MSSTVLYKKISAVMQDVQYLAKDDHIKFNKTNYRAISEEKVTSTVRESLIKNGLVILPVVQNHNREGTLSTVDTTYKIVDIETGEHELIVSSGTGVDTQDKGVGKAMTYSYKYLLLRTFAIPTGEDPDKVSSAELDDMQNKQQSSPNQAPKQVDKSVIKAKFIQNGFDVNKFESWISDQIRAGNSNNGIDAFLTKRLAEMQ